MPTRDQANAYRYDGSDRGHYESYFQRANHPERPLAFWIRYTVLVPRGRRADAVGELWAVFFDGESAAIRAVNELVPLSDCTLSERGLDVRIGGARLDSHRLQGAARTGKHRIGWSLSYDSPEPPLLLLSERLYGASFPKAKALVGSPLATFRGELEVDDQTVDVRGWVGSQNHNWGSQHTDRYAWGQVAGFDDVPDAFFECATARVKIGPVFLPAFSPMVLRFDGQEYRFNSIWQALKAKGNYDYFHWSLAAQNSLASIEATIHARAQQFIALSYGNPSGGSKICLNTKLAACELVLRRKGKEPVILKTAHRAAFEILTDDEHPAVPLLDVSASEPTAHDAGIPPVSVRNNHRHALSR
jgi:hypothetical protein